jgi:hypothetical protein
MCLSVMEVGMNADELVNPRGQAVPGIENRASDCDEGAVERAEEHVRTAAAEVRQAGAEIEHAEHDLERAEAELEEAEADRRHKVEVTVDRSPKCVEAGEYTVSAFKELVGVAADRELDILKDGALHPLEDDAKIAIHGCEVFVSHARTGGSS